MMLLRTNGHTIASEALANSSAIYARNGWVGITNTLIANHSIGISQTNAVTMVVQNTLFDGVTVGHTQETGGNGSVKLDNLLVGSAGFVNAAADDYHLGGTSLAIDHGATTSVSSDFEGQIRPQHNGPDIGMDESPYGFVAGLSISGPRNGKVGQTLSFTATLLDGTQATFAWLITPTTVFRDQYQAPTLTSSVFSHTFTSQGNYTVTVRASNPLGTLDYSIPVGISSGIIPRVYLPMTLSG